MKNEEMEQMLNRMQVPQPGETTPPPALKIPLLSYRRSSRAGLWLLLLPFTFAVTLVLKAVLRTGSAYLDLPRRLFAFIDDNAVLTYLIPVIFIGLPLLVMIINLLAICHFQQDKKARELLVTIKYRPLNIVLFLLSFALIVFFLLPDKLAF
jgi:hypothetical protein